MAMYLFALGVNEYRLPIQALFCYERDPRKVVSVFKERSAFIAEFIEARTVEAMVEKLRQLESGRQPQDVFAFYFSGHEKQHADDHFLLLPHADFEDFTLAAGARSVAGALSYRYLKHLTSRPRWTDVIRLFIFDACRTPLVGIKVGEPIEFDANDPLRDIILQHELGPEQVERGLTVLNFCEVDALACELPEDGHGPFTVRCLDLTRAREECHGALRIDAELCRALETEMHRRAQRMLLPRSISHRPALAGESIELHVLRNSPLRSRQRPPISRLEGPSRPPRRIPSVHPARRRPGGSRPNTGPWQVDIAMHGEAFSLRSSQTKTVPPDPAALTLKRDERLWTLVRRDPSVEHLKRYLSEASPSAPKGRQTMCKFNVLSSNQTGAGRLGSAVVGRRVDRPDSG